MDHSTPDFPVHHQPPEFTQIHLHWVSGIHPNWGGANATPKCISSAWELFESNFFLEDEWLFLKLESRWLFCESHLQEKSHFKEVSLYTSRRKTVLWNSSSIRKADINLHNNHTLPFLFLYFKYLFVYVAVPGWPSLKQARYLAVACEFLVVACKI